MNLLNGQEEILCKKGKLTIGDAEAGGCCRHSPKLEIRSADGELVWETTLDGLEENSLSNKQTSVVSDFKALLFSSERSILLAGNNKAMAVGLESGLVSGEASLHQTETSIDILELRETDAGSVFAVSARRIVAFSGSGKVTDEVDLPGPIISITGFADNKVLIRRYDVEDPALPEIEDSITFDV